MYPARLALTDKALLRLPLTASGQEIIRDAELSGFFVLVGKRRNTFMVQGDLRSNGKRQSIRVKIAEVGELNTREARAKAMMLLGSIAKGIDPRPQTAAVPESVTMKTDGAGGLAASGPTLRTAWNRYHDAHLKRKGRS